MPGYVRLFEFLKSASGRPKDISEIVFLTEYSDYFATRGELLHSIRKLVSAEFSLSTRDILVCGSAHVGYSIFKQREFIPGTSDLDLGIISPVLFSKMVEQVIDLTRGYTDLTAFDRRNGVNLKDEFVRYVAEKGMIRPDLLPNCPIKRRWFEFFDQLSQNHLGDFKKISAAIYLSESCFASKQVPTVLAAKRGIL